MNREQETENQVRNFRAGIKNFYQLEALRLELEKQLRPLSDQTEFGKAERIVKIHCGEGAELTDLKKTDKGYVAEVRLPGTARWVECDLSFSAEDLG